MKGNVVTIFYISLRQLRISTHGVKLNSNVVEKMSNYRTNFLLYLVYITIWLVQFESLRRNYIAHLEYPNVSCQFRETYRKS